jgi:hypothetical protein
MNIGEIGVQKEVSRNACVGPFTYIYTIHSRILASFWLAVFAALDESSQEKIFILAVYINSTIRLSQVSTVEACVALPLSFTFNTETSELAINWGQEYHPLFDAADFQYARGFCDGKVVYIDEVEYLPVIDGSPKFTEMQDLINYKKLAMASGNISIHNQGGFVDDINSLSLFNNDVAVYYLEEDARDEYTRDELTRLRTFILDDVGNSMRGANISLQDVRNTFDVLVPSELFSTDGNPELDDDLLDKPVPLLYGQARAVPAICTNSNATNGSGEYRVCNVLTNIGTVRVMIDEEWNTVTPESVSLATGSFTLSEKNTRGIENKGSWNPTTNTPTLSDSTGVQGQYYLCTATAIRDLGSGSVTFTSGEYAYFSSDRWSAQEEQPTARARKVRVESCIGETFDYLPEVIAMIDERENSIPFTDDFYDLDEWNAEKLTTGSGCVYISEQERFYDVIREIQDGSLRRFRYEVNAENKRTIRLDDYTREAGAFIPKEDILENEELKVNTDRETVFAKTVIEYNHDYEGETFETVVDSSQEAAVARNLRQKPTVTYSTKLRTKADAVDRAAFDAVRLGEVRKFAELTLSGVQYLTLRIYDIVHVELFTERREWLGIWKAQVIGTELKAPFNKVRLVLFERIPWEDENRILKIDDLGNIKITEDTNTIQVAK